MTLNKMKREARKEFSKYIFKFDTSWDDMWQFVLAYIDKAYQQGRNRGYIDYQETNFYQEAIRNASLKEKNRCIVKVKELEATIQREMLDAREVIAAIDKEEV